MSLRASKRSLELWDPISIYRGGKTLKNRHEWLKCEFERILLRKGRKGSALSSPEGSWAKAQKGAIRQSKSAEWCSWMLNILLCSSAFWTLFRVFINQSQNYLINFNCLTNQNWFKLIMFGQFYLDTMHVDRANLIMRYLLIR